MISDNVVMMNVRVVLNHPYRRGGRMSKTFKVTQQHIDLLQSTSVSWNDMEFGAPCIDPKMPYGNSMGIYNDIAEIIGLAPGGDEENFTNEQIDLMDKLHRETQTVLSIVLDTGAMQVGTYAREGYSGWKKVEEE